MATMSTLFREILPKQQDSPPSADIKFEPAYVISPVIPQKCGDLLRQLATEFPTLPTLKHLKRVRGRKDSTLSVFVGTVDSLQGRKIQVDHFNTGSVASQLSIVSVPARPPRSPAEADEFTAVWPTRFIPPPKPEASPLEDVAYVKRLQEGMQWAAQQGGAVVVDDATHTILATAQKEQQQQDAAHAKNNPLVTPILLAIQGVSRLERESILQQEQQQHASSSRRYLLTGLDVYTTLEPTVFEAMALLHARVRRVVCGRCRTIDGGWTQHGIHGLRHTNHRYRAFACSTS